MLSFEWDDEVYREVLLEEGREEGEKKRSFDVARNMRNEGDPVDKIARVTGLSEEAIASLP